MFRKTVAKEVQKNNINFRLRGHEVKRIEAFSDAVFGFAVTLLIVSLEVPKNFEELLTTMKGFFAFGVSFALLMLIWFEQNMFFRRYALDNRIIIFLNAFLMFIVLFYVYPLKFLFTLMFNSSSAGVQIEQSQVPELMYIYSGGYTIIYILFFFMYVHAYKKRNELELTPAEIFDTKTRMWAHLILVLIGALCVAAAFLLPAEKAGSSGFVYFLIGPAFSIFHSLRNKRKRQLHKEINE
jgi:uncharacterized membrane protein